MGDIQYWSKNHKKVLRVQQSMNGPYRAVAVRPDDARSFFASNYSVPSWANKYQSPTTAKIELRKYAAKNGLEEWRAES